MCWGNIYRNGFCKTSHLSKFQTEWMPLWRLIMNIQFNISLTFVSKLKLFKFESARLSYRMRYTRIWTQYDRIKKQSVELDPLGQIVSWPEWSKAPYGDKAYGEHFISPYCTVYCEAIHGHLIVQRCITLYNGGASLGNLVLVPKY